MPNVTTSNDSNVEYNQENHLRNIESIPKKSVIEFTKAEGGKLTPENIHLLQRIDLRFRKYDKQNDGYLSPKEFHSNYKLRLLPISSKQKKQPEQGLKKALPTKVGKKGLSSNSPGLFKINNGRITFNRRTIGGSDILAKEYFSRIDIDSDGKLNLTEFMLWQRNRITLHNVSRSVLKD